MIVNRPRRYFPLGLLMFVVMLFPVAACQPLSDLTPVQGRLTNLMGEGVPPGYTADTLLGEYVIPASYAGRRNPYTPSDQAAVSAGQQVYLSGAGALSCVICHAANGNGAGPIANSVDPQPANFASPLLQSAFRDHQDYSFWWVSEGLAKTVMPAYKDVLNETQRWQVITYCWYLGQQLQASGQASVVGGNRALIAAER